MANYSETLKKNNLPTGGIRTTFHTAGQPPAKKPKPEEQMAAQAAAQAVPTPLSVMLSQPVPQQQPQIQIQHVPPQQTPILPSPITRPPIQPVVSAAANTGVSLPVGVGIRLGGIGGVAPATAAGRPTAMAPPQYAQLWQPNNGVSDQALAERRQRNREHAKRSRVRKKFMLESLQEQVRQLQKENQHLRMLVQEHIPEHAMQIIADSASKNVLFGDREAEEANSSETNSLVRSDFSLMRSLSSGQKCFVLSDPKLPDNPIVFATPDFYKLTGYTAKEVLGRNCRFLQGPGTDKRAVEVIRKAIMTGSDATVCLLNYKADGTPFWNQFFIAALRDSDNNIVNFVGVQTEVEPETSGTSHLEDKVNAVLPLQNRDEPTS